MKFTAMRRFAFIAGVLFGGGWVAQAEAKERPLTAESLDTALADAHALAARHGDLQVLRVEGQSMLPFFGEGSVLVVKKIDAATLRAGMVAVYQNRLGETVAHRLVEAKVGGWVAQGHNNRKADTTLVNAANLIGVVYVTLHSSGQCEDAEALASLAAKTASVLAAPAK
jgi:signal peptidase I